MIPLHRLKHRGSKGGLRPPKADIETGLPFRSMVLCKTSPKGTKYLEFEKQHNQCEQSPCHAEFFIRCFGDCVLGVGEGRAEEAEKLSLLVRKELESPPAHRLPQRSIG